MMGDKKIVLGVETSCDETAVAIVTSDKEILAHKVRSQIDTHNAYGGVVPEIAARSHISHLDHLIKGCLAEAGLSPSDLSAIAATTGPGLIGGLMVGVMTAKAMAKAAAKPFIAVNHLAGHALTPRLTADVEFPFLLMLMSGGHCQILDVAGVDKFTRLGSTIDDATGEAFDKTAKLLGLGYPGGPAVEQVAAQGDPKRFRLPKPLVGRPGCDFSFSGLKTAVRRLAEDCVKDKGALVETDVADICAAFQQTLCACITDRLENAIDRFQGMHPNQRGRLVVAGGVAANKTLRTAIQEQASRRGFSFSAPPLSLCTDNGAMIAWAGMERLLVDPLVDDQHESARPRWPLDDDAEPLYGGGKKGRKA